MSASTYHAPYVSAEPLPLMKALATGRLVTRLITPPPPPRPKIIALGPFRTSILSAL